MKMVEEDALFSSDFNHFLAVSSRGWYNEQQVVKL